MVRCFSGGSLKGRKRKGEKRKLEGKVKLREGK